MKKLNLFAILLILLSLSCNQPAKTEVEKTTETEESNINSEIKSEEASLNEENILKLVAEIDLKRLAIESKESEPIEIETTTLREKIKQKWNKIHFYENEGIVVKIKTYPYEDISKRTEEFYADENGLILVVIEDNGLGEKGKTKDILDKMYYFSNGKIINKLYKNNEKEFSIGDSDESELISEFNEYLEVFKEYKAK